MTMNQNVFRFLFVLVAAFAMSTNLAQVQEEDGQKPTHYDEYRFTRFDMMSSHEVSSPDLEPFPVANE